MKQVSKPGHEIHFHTTELHSACFACKAHGATKQTAGWGFFPQQRNAVANYVDSPSQSYLRTQTGGSSVFTITFSRSRSTNADRELCSALTHRNQNSCWCFIIHIKCNNSSNFHIHSFYLSFYSHYIYTDKG